MSTINFWRNKKYYDHNRTYTVNHFECWWAMSSFSLLRKIGNKETREPEMLQLCIGNWVTSVGKRWEEMLGEKEGCDLREKMIIESKNHKIHEIDRLFKLFAHFWIFKKILLRIYLPVRFEELLGSFTILVIKSNAQEGLDLIPRAFGALFKHSKALRSKSSRSRSNSTWEKDWEGQKLWTYPELGKTTQNSG